MAGYQYLNIFSTNAEFITNKFDAFQSRVLETKPEIIAVVESGTQERQNSSYYMPSPSLNIEGYILHRKDNITEIKGGILVYTDEKLQISEVSCKKLRNASSEFQENILLNIKIADKSVLFGAFYRKGKSSPANNKCLRNLFNIASEKFDNIISCGDFNYPSINWKERLVNDTAYSESYKFYDCLLDNNLIQHVTDFTRKRGTDEPSLLDLIITEDTQTQVGPSIEYAAPLGKSDHCVLQWRYLVAINDEENDNNQEAVPVPRLNYNKGDYVTFRKHCSETDWENLLVNGNEQADLDDMVELFYDALGSMEKETIPEYTENGNKSKNKPPWLKKSGLKAIKRKYHAWKRFQTTKSHQAYQKYIKERNKTTKDLRSAKRFYEQKIASECKANPKAFFKYNNYKQKTKSNHIRLYKDNISNTLIIDDQENADKLNEYYKTVFTAETDEPELILNASSHLLFDEQPAEPFDCNIEPPNTSMNNISITKDEIYAIIKDIDVNKSSSPLCIHPRLLKEAAAELVEPIYIIFNKSLQQAKLPKRWTEGFVTPIHKGGDRHMCGNYRPITITSVLCRVLEKLIKEKILVHLTDNKLLSTQQHGFTSRRSCMTNLLQTMEYISRLTDLGIPVDEVFLDFAKAFDKVPHQRLLYKLQRYGICPELLTWIESFLKERTQTVRVKSSYSKKINVTSGVPQGSILGPILFLLYINDLPLNVTANNNIFADDTKLYTKANNLNDANCLQDDLDTLSEWCKTWGMKLNTEKCHIMHYGSKNQLYLYHLNGRLLTTTATEKDLGVVMSNDLKPEAHIKHCIAKANLSLGMIRRTFTDLTKEIFLKVYKVYVRPILEYCQEIWAPHLEQDKDTIEKVQRRATKMVKGLKDLTYEDRLRELKLFKLSDRRKRGDMITVYKLINGLIDMDYSILFKLNENVNVNMNTRSHRWQISHTRMSDMNTDMRRHFFSQRIVVPWNNLPPAVVNSTSVDSFKRNYDTLILNSSSTTYKD